MKPFRSLRLRITLLCALLLTLCCAALAVTSNLSAIHLTDTIAAMARAHRESRALCQGDFQELVLTNRQTIFQRKTEGERVLVAVNADAEPYVAHFDAGCGLAWDLITGEKHDFGGGSQLPPYSAQFWKMER